MPTNIKKRNSKLDVAELKGPSSASIEQRQETIPPTVQIPSRSPMAPSSSSFTSTLHPSNHVSDSPTSTPTSSSSMSPKSKESVILEHLAKISMESPLTAAEEEEEDDFKDHSSPSSVMENKQGKKHQEAPLTSSSSLKPRLSTSPTLLQTQPTQSSMHHKPSLSSPLVHPSSSSSSSLGSNQVKGSLLSPQYYQSFKQAKQNQHPWITSNMHPSTSFPYGSIPPSPTIQVDAHPMQTGEGYLPILTKEPMVAMPVYLPGLGLQYVLTPMLPFYVSKPSTQSNASSHFSPSTSSMATGVTSPEDEDVVLTQLAKPPSTPVSSQKKK